MDFSTVLETYKTKLTAKLAALGFDPTIIIAIITAIVQAIGACPKPPTPPKLKTPGVLERIYQRLYLRKHVPHLHFTQYGQIEEANVAVANDSTDEELTAFVAGASSM